MLELNHQKVLEQNKQYFSQKQRMLEEQRRHDDASLEDLIREINSTVNKVVGNSDEESEYIEDEKYPEEIREQIR